MRSSLNRFEQIARRAFEFTDSEPPSAKPAHPFEVRGVHPSLFPVAKDLFDDGHYAQATFEAFKFVDRQVGRLAADGESGFKLMMKVFTEASPMISLTSCKTTSEKDEQKGFQFLFAGAILAIRNPRGHEYGLRDDPDTCLDHLGLASLLLRRLEHAGYAIP